MRSPGTGHAPGVCARFAESSNPSFRRPFSARSAGPGAAGRQIRKRGWSMRGIIARKRSGASVAATQRHGPSSVARGVWPRSSSATSRSPARNSPVSSAEGPGKHQRQLEAAMAVLGHRLPAGIEQKPQAAGRARPEHGLLRAEAERRASAGLRARRGRRAAPGRPRRCRDGGGAAPGIERASARSRASGARAAGASASSTRPPRTRCASRPDAAFVAERDVRGDEAMANG